MKDRIRKLMEHLQMNQLTFANHTGINTGTLSSILAERTRPTLNIVQSICNAMPNVNMVWLVSGSGEMFVSDDSHGQDETSTALQPSIDTVSPPDLFSQGSDTRQPVTPGQPVRGYEVQDPAASKLVRQQRTTTPVLNFDAKNIDKTQRKITEIRVFYDDQTWESFVPKK